MTKTTTTSVKEKAGVETPSDDLSIAEQLRKSAEETAELAAQLSEEIARSGTANVPFGRDDVGSELIAILSEGLYHDPRDALREYVQNAVDADSAEVIIEMLGRTVAIRDHGRGMDLNALLEARKVAKSPKIAGGSVGFRGIGIYAAVNLCDRLVIETQTAHSDVQYKMTFDFAEMNRILGLHRSQPGSQQMSLAAMLSACTRLAEAEVDPLDHGVTVVTLEDIRTEAYREIHDIKELEDYLINALPIAYDPEFKQAKSIEQFLSTFIPSYRTINVRLIDKLQEIDKQIYRRFPEGIGAPIFFKAESAGRLEAVIWACMRTRERLKDGGLVFKMHGFSVGNRNKPRALYLKREQTYEWIFGEIYVIDDEIRPNAARNDFESGPARRRLELAVKECLADLGKLASTQWTFDRATQEFASIGPEIAALKESVNGENARSLVPQHYADVQKLRTRIKKQRLQSGPRFNELKEQAALLGSSLDEIETVLKDRWAVEQVPKPTATKKETPTAREGTSAKPVKAEPSESGVTLAGVFAVCGKALSPAQSRVVKVIEAALDRSVGRSPTRDSIEYELERELRENGM